MFCSKCGSSVPEGIMFCGNCGNPMAQLGTQAMNGVATQQMPAPQQYATQPLNPQPTLVPTPVQSAPQQPSAQQTAVYCAPLPMTQYMSQNEMITQNKKTQYVMNFNANPNDVIAMISSWLTTKGARYMQEDNILYYEMGDAFIGKRSFEYYIQGNQLIILAYLRTPRKPSSLKRGMVGAAATVPYDNSISDLLQTINGLSQANVMNVQQNAGFESVQSQQLNQGQNYINQTVKSFSEASSSRMDKMAIGAFAFSLADLFLALFGYTFGAILVIFAYYFGYLGLKSNKKTLAIASIVLTTVALGLFFFSLFRGAPIIDL